MTRRSLQVVAAPSPTCTPTKRGGAVPSVRSFAPLFRVLSDETRLEILALLASAAEPVCVCDIEAHIGDLSQSTISHHLKLLREAGLVSVEKHGTWSYYTLQPSALEPLRTAHRALVKP